MTREGLAPLPSTYHEYAVTLLATTRLDMPVYRVTTCRLGFHAYLTVSGAATAPTSLGILLPCRTRSCVVHGFPEVPQPDGTGARACTKSSYEVNWRLRTWALACTRALAMLSDRTVVNTTDVRAPITISPSALAMTTSINVKPAWRLCRAAVCARDGAPATSRRSLRVREVFID